jgi:hypothetical protein
LKASQEHTSSGKHISCSKIRSLRRQPATLLQAGLVLEAHKSECYDEETDGDADQLLMSLSPSVINKQHSDLWGSRMADISKTFISEFQNCEGRILIKVLMNKKIS